MRGRLLLSGVRLRDLNLFEVIDLAEAALIEPTVSGGTPIDVVLDKLHQAMFDSHKDSWGEGPLAERQHRAMMTVGEARRRTPEEVAEMNRRKAELKAKHRLPVLEQLAGAFRAYARNREGATE